MKQKWSTRHLLHDTHAHMIFSEINQRFDINILKMVECVWPLKRCGVIIILRLFKHLPESFSVRNDSVFPRNILDIFPYGWRCCNACESVKPSYSPLMCVLMILLILICILNISFRKVKHHCCKSSEVDLVLQFQCQNRHKE